MVNMNYNIFTAVSLPLFQLMVEKIDDERVDGC